MWSKVSTFQFLLTLSAIVTLSMSQVPRVENFEITDANPNSCAVIVENSRFDGDCCSLNTTEANGCVLNIVNGRCKVRSMIVKVVILSCYYYHCPCHCNDNCSHTSLGWEPISRCGRSYLPGCFFHCILLLLLPPASSQITGQYWTIDWTSTYNSSGIKCPPSEFPEIAPAAYAVVDGQDTASTPDGEDGASGLGVTLLLALAAGFVVVVAL